MERCYIMKYLVVIPARGGSKGIPRKNIFPLAGKPLLEYAIECICDVQFDGDVVVSTDDELIADVASRYNKVTVIRRPKEISGDTASTEAALIHALGIMEENTGQTYDAVITLQPTSPLRTSETIQKFLKAYEKAADRYDAMLTLSEDRSDFWIKKEDGSYGRLFPEAPRRRQEREPLYVENSAIYVTRKESLLESRSVLGNNVNGYVIDPVEGIDINEISDIALAETVLQMRKGKR